MRSPHSNVQVGLVKIRRISAPARSYYRDTATTTAEDLSPDYYWLPILSERRPDGDRRLINPLSGQLAVNKRHDFLRKPI